MRSIGKRIKKIRTELGMTQVEFAANIGVKGAVVSAWEGGKAHVPHGRALIICEAYGVNEAWLRFGLGQIFAAESSDAQDARTKAQEYAVSILERMPVDLRNDVLDFCRSVLKRF